MIDPVHNVDACNCITRMVVTPEGYLWISCNMPRIQVAPVRIGNTLPVQAACLEAIVCKGKRRRAEDI